MNTEAAAEHVAPDRRIAPFHAEMLEVGNRHSLYVEQVGCPEGLPIVFLHGGPGSGCQLHHRELFDADRFRTILFDQRGAGRSRPYLRLEANTTHHLVEDLERIRAHLGIDRWLVVGGSWGSTLALAYAERFPEQVYGLVLRAIFLGTEQELDWAFVEGPKRFRPELFAELSEFLLPSERSDIVGSFMRRLSNPHPMIHAPAAALWYAAERVLSRTVPLGATLAGNMPPPDIVPPTPIMQAHYFRHYCFLEPGQLLANAHRLAGIPGVIVQGRHDLLCPPATANSLSAAWPRARLCLVEGAGHSMAEPGITEAIVEAVDELADRASE